MVSIAVPKYDFCIILELCTLWYLFWLVVQNTNGYSMALLCKCSSTVSRSYLTTKVIHCMFLNFVRYVLFTSDFRLSCKSVATVQGKVLYNYSKCISLLVSYSCSVHDVLSF